jgi:hypothetical protein
MATSAEATRPADQITFAHNSERQFARLLDFYRVEWQYEPTAFAIEWDASGQPVQLFRPDFYLPRFGLYIEITTLNQRLVTKKNRKVRRLRELYPDVRIKVLYQRDYLSLLAKYGLEPPSQMLDPDTLRAEGRPAGEGGAGSPSGPARPGPRPAAPERPGRAGPTAVSRRGGAIAPAQANDRGGTAQPATGDDGRGGTAQRAAGDHGRGDTVQPAAGHHGRGGPDDRVGTGRWGGAVERVRDAGRPRVVPDPPRPVPPLPADPELVRLAQVLLPAEKAQRRGPAAAKRAG